MRKFLVNVNGKQYDVEIEEVGSFSAPASAPVAAPAAPVAPAAAAAPIAAPVAAAPAPAPVSAAGGEPINAPMPGTILDVKVSEGQTVKRGDVLCILEAMKMENEILAPRDGKVLSAIGKNTPVNSGDLLISLG